MDKEQAISRGKRAELLLKDELLNEAFTTLEKQLIEHWRDGTHINDTNARERLFQAVHIVGKVKKCLALAASNGKIAQSDLDDIAQPQKRGLLKLV